MGRENVRPTDSFIFKQSFRLFHINFHLSVDQSLTVLTQLAYGTVIKGAGPCISDLDPDLPTQSAASLPSTLACPAIQTRLCFRDFVYLTDLGFECN